MKYTIHEYKAHELEITPQLLQDLLIKFFASRIYINPYNEEEFIRLLLKLKTEKEVKEYLETSSTLDEWDIGDLVTIYNFIKMYDKTIQITKVRQ